MKDIQRKTRKRYSSEEKIRIVVAGLCGEASMLSFAGRKGHLGACITAGRRSSHGNRDTVREAKTGQVKDLRRDARDLEEIVAELALELRLLKKA